jgi:hypothetical protein
MGLRRNSRIIVIDEPKTPLLIEGSKGRFVVTTVVKDGYTVVPLSVTVELHYETNILGLPRDPESLPGTMEACLRVALVQLGEKVRRGSHVTASFMHEQDPDTSALRAARNYLECRDLFARRPEPCEKTLELIELERQARVDRALGYGLLKPPAPPLTHFPEKRYSPAGEEWWDYQQQDPRYCE